AVVGAAKALAFGVPAGAAVVMGVLTATFGGVLRDVLAEEPSVLLKREIYVSAALVAACVFVVLNVMGVPQIPSALAGFGAGLAVRAGAILFRWSLPGFPGRAAPDEAD
ncbi:MAG: putative membrane protein YeiH, partial [Pseudoalteromonas distincta]